MIACRTFDVAEETEELPELADAQPFDLVGAVGDVGGGFVGESGDDDSLHAGDAGGVGQKERINAAAGDDPERVWRLHERKRSSARSTRREATGEEVLGKAPGIRRPRGRGACDPRINGETGA